MPGGDAMAAKVTVSIEHLSNDLGLWCLDCNLSTAARVWFTTRTGSETTLRSSAFCTECGGRRVE